MEKTVGRSAVDVDTSGEEPVNGGQNFNPRDSMKNSQWILTCVVLYLGAILYGLDTTIAADVQGQVYEALGHIENLPWIGLGFPMASVATILPLGRAYALFDIKTLLLSSIFVFELGSAICGAAPTSDALIIGRAIAGIGGAGMYLGIFPVHFLKSRILILLYVATGSAGAAQGVVLYYIPLFFQFTKGDSPLQAAVRLLPFVCTFIFFVMAAGATLPIVGRYNLYYLAGGCFIVIGGALLCTIDESTSASKIYGYEALSAIGIGLLFQIGYAVAVAKVSPEDEAKAIGFINIAQIGTLAIALAIAGSLFQNVGFNALKSAFAGRHLTDDYIRSALAGTLSPVFSSNDEELIHITIVAIARTIRKIFSTVAAAGALAIISSLLMKFEKIDLSIVAGG
ncbi:hypothetical protein ACHAQJ_004072 [Trichoderma viride]